MVVNNFNDRAVFLRNDTGVPAGNWVKLKLTGKQQKDAIGARLLVTTPSGNKIWREVQTATGYLSQHPKTQHIGLGKDTTVDVTVIWPNGERKEYKGLAAGKVHTLEQ